jgi:hypothetical protein
MELKKTKMMLRKLILLSIGFIVCLTTSGQPKLSSTDLIKIDVATLEKNKKAIASKDSYLLPAYTQLLKLADQLLQYKPVSVMEKTEFPPSGDKHDYMSLAPYWWPDSAKPNGLPYIRKDGETNPEVKNYPDKNNMPKLCENIYFLGLAYYYSNNKEYAKHAVKLLQVWFLDKKTKMNPNLNFGQIIKGVNDGRGAGIIDTRQFIFALDGVSLIKDSKYWSKKKHKGLQDWFAAYLSWLNTSTNGKDELDANNNHGVWYDAQALTFANFIEDKEQAKKIIERATKRLDTQMNKDGFFPLELARTTSLHSTFIMNAFFIIAQQAQKIEVDFWNVETASGKSLRKALQAMLPFIIKEKKWTGPQIKPFDFKDGYALLIYGATKLNCTTCYDALKKIAGEQNVIYRLL